MPACAPGIGIRLNDQYAHDRNVSVAVENESRDVNAPAQMRQH